MTLCFSAASLCWKSVREVAEVHVEQILTLISLASFVGVSYILLHIKWPTQEDTLPDVSAAHKKSMRLYPQVYHMLNESGATCAETTQAGPVKMGEKTCHGSLGRGTLILRECPGSVMGNKSSVISHRGRTTLWPYTRVLVCFTSWLQRQGWHDRLYTEKRTLINDWGNVPLQKNAEDIIIWNLVTLQQTGRQSNVKSKHNFISCLLQKLCAS